jgi:phospholipase/carboxylesterase
VLAAGEPIDRASAAMILVHGRGASARDILTIAAAADTPGFAYLAPEAAGGAWYPNRFMEPIESNQPWLDSALELIATILAQVGERLPAEKVILLGFSQGGCLSLEFAARNARRYGALVGLSGGLIGPDGTPRDYRGSLAGTPVFLGCSDVDPHIPATRVLESARVLETLGGQVQVELYPGLGHEVNQDEIRIVQTLMAAVLRRDEVGESTQPGSSLGRYR